MRFLSLSSAAREGQGVVVYMYLAKNDLACLEVAKAHANLSPSATAFDDGGDKAVLYGL